jgi:hypothetical protein
MPIDRPSLGVAGDEEGGLRAADGEHRYYDVGLEHLVFYVDTRAEVDEAYQRCLDIGARIHYPPEQDRDLDDFYELFVATRTGSASRLLARRRRSEGTWTIALRHETLVAKIPGGRDESAVP